MSLHGELDRATIVTLGRELADCLRKRTPLVVIDLAGLEFLDGAAFRLLLDFGLRQRDSGRHLSLVNPTRQVRRILTIVSAVHAADVLDEWLEEPVIEA